MHQRYAVAVAVAAGSDRLGVSVSHAKHTVGDKCKFSHDLFIARKAEKIDIYTDKRDLDDKKAGDDMESGNWDQKKLEQVVSEKEKAHANRPVTDIVRALIATPFSFRRDNRGYLFLLSSFSYV